MKKIIPAMKEHIVVPTLLENINSITDGINNKIPTTFLICLLVSFMIISFDVMIFKELRQN